MKINETTKRNLSGICSEMVYTVYHHLLEEVHDMSESAADQHTADLILNEDQMEKDIERIFFDILNGKYA